MGSNRILPAENSLAVLTREISRMLSRALEKQIKNYGVTITQYYYLRVLWDEDGLSQQELSGRVGTKAPSTAITLRGMEKAGYIRRIRNTKDGRIVNTLLTNDGKKLKSELLPIAARINAQVLRILSTKEKDMLWAIMNRLKRTMAKWESD